MIPSTDFAHALALVAADLHQADVHDILGAAAGAIGTVG